MEEGGGEGDKSQGEKRRGRSVKKRIDQGGDQTDPRKSKKFRPIWIVFPRFWERGKREIGGGKNVRRTQF